MCLIGTEALSALLGRAQNHSLVDALVKANVEFVIIGGTALAYYGLRDACVVDDLDLMFESGEDTAKGILSVLSTLMPSNDFTTNRLALQGIKIPLKNRDFDAELLIADKSVEIRNMLDTSVKVSLSGTTVCVASVNHLRKLKEQAVIDYRNSLEKHECDLALDKHERDLAALKLFMESH